MSCGCGCGGEVVAYENWNEHVVDETQNAVAAEYKGRKVTLNKPFRTKGANKKFGVYTKNEKGNVVLVRFGDPNMEIKRDDPARRKSFRSRHRCDTPGPKWKARYWSCRQWRSSSPVEASSPCGCGCEEDVEAKDADDPCTDGYEQYGMKMKNGRKVPNCIPIKKKAEATGCGECNSPEECDVAGMCLGDASNIDTADMVAAEPTPKSDETHDEYMSRCQAAGYSKEQCMKAHEGHNFGEDASYDKEEEEAGMYMKKRYANEDCVCGIGEELVNGSCQKIAVTLDVEINEMSAIVEASTGKTIIEISGVAFHEGMNKNNWELTKEGAYKVVEQMKGSDLTLNHPQPNPHGAGFERNMDGGVDEANVGYITEANVVELESGKWEVHYKAHVVRSELFSPLEAGMWSREDYGVSIGGSGVPISATDDGIVFGEDFTFDHLAIVHRPAYPRATIDDVKRVEVKEIEATIISHSVSDKEQELRGITMTEEESTVDYEAEIEALKADLVMANSRVTEFEAAEEARIEETRMSLVMKASEMGMSGHDDLKAETLETLIASWEASHPVETPVEMKPVEEVASEAPVIASESKSTSVVANYLNGKLVETDEDLYGRAWNAWAKAWNGTLAGDESDMKAPLYSEIKEMN